MKTSGSVNFFPMMTGHKRSRSISFAEELQSQLDTLAAHGSSCDKI